MRLFSAPPARITISFTMRKSSSAAYVAIPPFWIYWSLPPPAWRNRRCSHTCLRLRQALEKALTVPEYRDLEVQLLGPAPAAVAKINDRYRYRLTMRGKNQKRLRELVAHLLRQAQRDPRNRGVSLFADINPID